MLNVKKMMVAQIKWSTEQVNVSNEPAVVSSRAATTVGGIDIDSDVSETAEAYH